MSLSIQSAVKRFSGKSAVDGVTVDIPAGTFFVVLGASGCGKSTLLKLIAGLETLDGGSIAIDGKVVAGPGAHMPPERRNIGMVFQSYALWPHMSVAKNVAFPIETAGERNAADEAMRHLKTVALDPFADRMPASLSGGQRQRVALARCLAQGAKTVLMDEPLANLDPHLRGAMEEELARFHAASGATTVYITHDQREAMALAGQMAVMADGRFLQVAAPETIYARPANETVARFVGRSAIVDMVVEPTGPNVAKGQFAGTSLALATDAQETARRGRIVIRPEDVRFADQSALKGLVETIAYRGGTYEGTLRLADTETILPFSSRRRLERGERVGVSIDHGWLLPA